MLELGVLGPLTAVAGGRRVGLGAAMQRRLLAVLACRAGEQVPVDVLIDALWDADPPPTARKTLQVYVRRLRQGLGAERIRHHTSGYWLELRRGELDAHRFADLADGARAARHRGDLPAAGALLEQASHLWRGDPYADVPDVALVAEEAARLREQRLQASEDRFEVALAIGRHAELVPELGRLTSVHPYRERLRGHLMLALYRSGRQAEALAAFRDAHATFARELGIEPGAALRDLHAQILRADPALDWSPAAPPAHPGPAAWPAAAFPVPRQLPGDVPAFTGRQEALAALDALLPAADRAPAGPVGVAAITGPASVGKTALAVRWAHRVAERFAGGHLYVDLRGSDPRHPPVSTAEAMRDLLDAFGVPARRMPASLAAQGALYRSLVADKRILLVLDDASSAEQIRPLLPGGAGCVAVVTSRNDLTELVAAHGAQPLALPPLTTGEARELLVRRLGPARVAADPGEMDEIIARCAGLPAALAVAAARVMIKASL
ncbi:AfsR/SARP family transcriptional regulator [Actinomycetes bacterium KLBMP 9797]